MNDGALDQRVTQICELGCTRVREVIAAWEQDHVTVESAGLNQTERARVLAELKAIMAVYDARQ